MKIIYESYELPESEFLERINKLVDKTEKLSKLNEKLQTALADAHYELGKVKRMSVFEFMKWRRN